MQTLVHVDLSNHIETKRLTATKMILIIKAIFITGDICAVKMWSKTR
jgi:hypothetical protein